MGVNIYENGPVSHLYRVASVEDQPGQFSEKGVHLAYTSTSKPLLPEDQPNDSEISYSTWDGRFSSDDIQRGDIIRMEEQGPSAAVLVEIFREDMLVYPQRPEVIQMANELAESHKNFRAHQASLLRPDNV